MARKILLADDSVTAQNMGRKILTDAGYEVITVNNGSAALKRVAEQKPDLIVLDVYMPGYSGLEVCQRLKDAHETSRIPILLTVGKLEPFKPEEARRVNADAFIVKPFEASELLSALTRLEDRMVPQAEGSRFSTNVSGIERFGADAGFGRRAGGQEVEVDNSWKNRLRFPSKKPKVEEPESEEDFGTTPSRDFKRSATSKPAVPSAPFQVSPAVQQEPGLVPDIPRDITPDELDALSALAAKLDGPIPASEDIVPVGGKLGPAEPSRSDSKTEPETKPEALAEVATAPVETPTGASEESAPKMDAAPAIEAAQPSPVETTPSVPAPVDEVTPEEAVSAPIDRTDEPLFAQTAPIEEGASEEKESEVAETPAAAIEPATVDATQPQVEPQESATVDVAKTEEPKPEEAIPSVESPQVEVAEAAAIATEPAPVETVALPSEHIPSEEELAEALRLLTPSQPPSEVRTQEPITVPPDVVQALEEVGQRTGMLARWTAEPVALTPEEASVSLEAEMMEKFAGAAKSEETAVPTPIEAPGASVSLDSPPELSEPAAKVEEQVAEAAPENKATMIVEATQTTTQEAESDDQEEEPAATTFADAIQPVEEPESEPAVVDAAPELELPGMQASQESSSESEEEAGGEESMGKVTKGKSGWHQIRTASTPASAADPVQAAKEAEAEEAPKAMAAAASGDGSSSSTLSGDASAIASIVDSVLADLRPKIVEEIAKKLAKKD